MGGSGAEPVRRAADEPDQLPWRERRAPATAPRGFRCRAVRDSRCAPRGLGKAAQPDALRRESLFLKDMKTLRDLGLAIPIVQAPMAGVQDYRLAVAVCETGALG